MPEKQIRLFVAAAITPELHAYFQEQTRRVNQKDWRIVPDQNLHLTLLFIGNLPESNLSETLNKLEEIAREQKPFTLQLQRIEPGPNSRSPRLIWARFRQSPAFEDLSRKLQQALAPEVSLPKEAIPHITLARKRKEVISPETVLFPEPDQQLMLPVTEIGLWKSELGQPHPAYRVLEAFTLVKSGA